MKYVFIVLTAVIVFFICGQKVQAVEKGISVIEYNKITMSLYKEVRSMAKEGLLLNDCGLGACAAPELLAWYKKVLKHRDTPWYGGQPVLWTSLEDAVFVGDLYFLARYPNEDRGIAAMYKFESAMLCYDNPKICEKHIEPRGNLKW